eukprot:147933-Rhodomonas_salina.1
MCIRDRPPPPPPPLPPPPPTTTTATATATRREGAENLAAWRRAARCLRARSRSWRERGAAFHLAMRARAARACPFSAPFSPSTSGPAPCTHHQPTVGSEGASEGGRGPRYGSEDGV